MVNVVLGAFYGDDSGKKMTLKKILQEDLK